MVKEEKLSEGINKYIGKYESELAKQQAKSILNNLSFIYCKVKILIIELEGVENCHEKAITIIKNYNKYLYKIKDGELDYINDILYEQKEFKKKYEIIKKGSNRYIDYPPLTKIRKKKKCNELEIYSYYQINKISFDEIEVEYWESKIWK